MFLKVIYILQRLKTFHILGVPGESPPYFFIFYIFFLYFIFYILYFYIFFLYKIWGGGIHQGGTHQGEFSWSHFKHIKIQQRRFNVMYPLGMHIVYILVYFYNCQ